MIEPADFGGLFHFCHPRRMAVSVRTVMVNSLCIDSVAGVCYRPSGNIRPRSVPRVIGGKMNKFGLMTIVLAAAAACAQEPAATQGATQPTTPTAPAQQQAKPATPQVAQTNRVAVSKAPTVNDMYCSGFVLKEGLQKVGRISSGWDSPFETRYVSKGNENIIYLDHGSFSKDQQFLVVRPFSDPNRYDMTPHQTRHLKDAGQYYMEVGRVRVMDVQNGIGIARVDLSCDALVPGDIATPFSERPVPQFRKDAAWDFVAPPNGKLTGTLLMGREYDGFASQRGKVYLNVGSNQGVKPGDYFRVTRTYMQMTKDPADNQPIKSGPVEYGHKDAIDSRSEQKRFHNLPRKSIGELMVLYTTPTTATATVTRSWEQLQAGDGVELMEEPPAEAAVPAQPTPMNPPTVTCMASPASIHVGESATIHCQGSSPDNRELSYNFATDAGGLSPHNDTAVLSAANAQPGVVTVTTTVSDDRGQTGSTTTKVNVEAAAPTPEASSAGAFNFKPNSAYVNNQAKAMLDQIALRLQREAGSSVMLAGHVSGKEAAKLAIARATNAKNYLVKEKGIDTSRVQVADAGPGDANVEIWFVPAGATMPNLPTQPQQ
jgi:outer membrane protein OmpA-like peptidoglycan-associated protein